MKIYGMKITRKEGHEETYYLVPTNDNSSPDIEFYCERTDGGLEQATLNRHHWNINGVGGDVFFWKLNDVDAKGLLRKIQAIQQPYHIEPAEDWMD